MTRNFTAHAQLFAASELLIEQFWVSLVVSLMVGGASTCTEKVQ